MIVNYDPAIIIYALLLASYDRSFKVLSLRSYCHYERKFTIVKFIVQATGVLYPCMFCNLYLVKNHKIVNSAITYEVFEVN